MADAFLETGPAGAGVTDVKSGMDGSGAPASPFTVKLVDAETEDLITIGARLSDGRKRPGEGNALSGGFSADDEPEGRLTAEASFSARAVLSNAKTLLSDRHYAVYVPTETLRAIWDTFPELQDPTLEKTAAEIRVNGDVFSAEVEIYRGRSDLPGDALLLYPKDDQGVAKPFTWAFGLTQIDVVLHFGWEFRVPAEKAHHVLRCDPVMVLQPEGDTARRFLAMADRVAEGFPTWFAPAAPKTLVRESTAREFNGVLEAAKTILAAYERLLPWFRMSPKTKTRSSQTLGSAEQMRSFTAATAAYIATHPDELMESAVDTGVRIGARAFLPKRTLIDGAMEDRDIPENRAVVGFLMSVEQKLAEAFQIASGKVGPVGGAGGAGGAVGGVTTPDTQPPQPGAAQRPARRRHFTQTEHGRYVAGTALLEAFAAHEPQTHFTVVDAIRLGFEVRRAGRIRAALAGAFPFHARALPRMPFPTPVFERIGPYREVWHLMRAWFKSGLGGNAKPAVATEVKEDFVLEALDTPRLYERLVVTVLLDGIRSAGLTLASVDSIPWPTHPVTSANRWVFTGSAADGADARVTLWYEPAIYAPGDADRHGVELLRTTSWRLRPEGLVPGIPRAQLPLPPHYAPDVVILVETKEKDEGTADDWSRTWLVGDAKLRRPLKTVESEVMRAMMKYGVTTRPVRPADRMECVRLMCAIPERGFTGMTLSDLAPAAGPDVSVEVLTPDALSTGLVERVHALLGAGPVSGGWKAATAVGPTDAVRV